MRGQFYAGRGARATAGRGTVAALAGRRASPARPAPGLPVYSTPLTPVTGETPVAVLAGQEVPADSLNPTPMASAPTPIDGELTAPLPPENEATPGQIGRFEVLQKLGSGGMGVVYVAYDSQLDRKVALKVLRARVSQTKGDKARKRLHREAQAMAQLSHPNVVAIYDWGTVNDQVFLAMEFVKGVTLTKWLQAEKRGWQQVLSVYMQAGRGLSAAHRAGIIHRDFKPDNVLIDGEGRVRVVDFGLARADAGSGVFQRPDTYADAIKSMSEGSMLDMRITRTGGMTGTPAYMAPEQYLGHPTDPRTDQFSFCVALYEGLYGVRPFLGERVAVVREAVLSGAIQDVPKDSVVPLWLRRIVARGLAVRPEDRFRSMDDLLARLADDPRRPVRRWLMIGGATLLVGGAALVARDLAAPAVPAAAPQPHALCDADAALAGVWDPPRREAVVAALAAARDGETRARRVVAVLDDYAAAWRAAVEGACGERGAEPFELRAPCLQRRLAALGALSDALAVGDAADSPRALAAAWALPGVRSCDAPTGQAGERRAGEAALARLDAAAMHGALGDGGRALAQVQEVARAAVEADDLPLQAEALYQQARLEHAAGDAAAAERSLLGALWAAEASRRGELAIDGLTLLLEVLGELGRDAEGVALWPRLTRSLLERRDDGRRESAALHAYGRVLLRRGQYPEAAAQLALALRLGERHHGATHPEVGELQVDLAVAHLRLGSLAEAARLLDGAVALLQGALTERDPSLARAYLARAEAARRRGRPRDAAADYELAARLLVGLGRPDARMRMSEVRLGLARVAADEARWAAAAEGAAEALALRERLRGADDPSLVEPLLAQCAAASALGRHAAAVSACRRALGLAERAKVPDAGPARVALADALWAQAQASGAASPAVRAQILGLARVGLEELQRTPHPDATAIARTAAWIAERAGR
jgi:predicted Ser/Thr protein kinase/tetratricopeptide (TPR) repeat protein